MEQLRRVGSDSEGQGGVSNKRKRKNSLPAAVGNKETLPPSLSLPYLSSSGLSFFFFLRNLIVWFLLVTQHIRKVWKKTFLFIAALLAIYSVRVCVCPVCTRSVILCAAHFLTEGGGGHLCGDQPGRPLPTEMFLGTFAGLLVSLLALSFLALGFYSRLTPSNLYFNFTRKECMKPCNFLLVPHLYMLRSL